MLWNIISNPHGRSIVGVDFYAVYKYPISLLSALLLDIVTQCATGFIYTHSSSSVRRSPWWCAHILRFRTFRRGRFNARGTLSHCIRQSHKEEMIRLWFGILELTTLATAYPTNAKARAIDAHRLWCHNEWKHILSGGRSPLSLQAGVTNLRNADEGNY